MITFNQTQESITSTEMVELISINSLQGIQEGVFDSVIIISDGISSLAKFGGEKFPELLSAVENYSKVFLNNRLIYPKCIPFYRFHTRLMGALFL